jgi:hypothetical protein
MITLQIKRETNIFGELNITISKKGFIRTAEVFNEEEADNWILKVLTEFSIELVRKMYSQKEFFFNYKQPNESMLKTFSKLADCLRRPLTLDIIKSDIIVLLSDLKPHKTATHYELYNNRYEWLFSFLYGTPNNVNARELHIRYILKQKDQLLKTA